ncbi:hypothetical protein BBK14_33430 [Parafrankia soli]|uniref:Uncharacterized protein n=1 Tax=Parafrankia soli TaxID=2599596 RepID=A0A1S1QKV7_9ACTN|nr:hypothetical protein [Parafrankia soli]OHV35393.1 hypothetical protein BBK14_33430 [Parafrankia soli]
MTRLTHTDLPRLAADQPLLLNCGADREPAPVRVVAVDGPTIRVTSDVFQRVVPGGSTGHSPVELFWPDGGAA